MFLCDECTLDPDRHFPAQLALPPCLHFLIITSVPFIVINVFLLDAAIRGFAQSRKAKFTCVLWIQAIAMIASLLLACVLSFLAFGDYVMEEPVIYAAKYRLFGYSFLAIAIVESIVFFLFQYKKGYSSTGRMWTFWLIVVFSLIPTTAYTSNVLSTGYKEDPNAVEMSKSDHIWFLTLFVSCFINWVIAGLPTVDRSFAKKHHPETYSSFLSQVTMGWSFSLLYTGFKKSLTLDDIWDARDEDTAEECTKVLAKCWNKELRSHGYGRMAVRNIDKEEADMNDDSEQLELGSSNNADPLKTKVVDPNKAKTGKKPSLFRAMMAAYGATFFITVVYKCINDILVFVGPKIMEWFMRYMEEDGSSWYGMFLAFLLLLNSLVLTVFLQRYFYLGMTIGMSQRSALIDLVYRKALVLSSEGRQQSTVGQIVNLMSVDSQKFMDLMTYINLLWSAPLQITIALVMLYQQLGPASFAGLAYMILTMPLNIISGNAMKKFQVKQMKEKDNRVKLLTDVLNGIKVLKLYAWEKAFISKLRAIRSKEISLIKKAGYLMAVTSFFWICSPYMVALFAFTAYILMGNVLYPTTAFVSLTLFNILRFPMSVLPMMVTNLVQAKVALDRLTKFLLLAELQTNAVSHDETKGFAIQLKNCTFAWNSDESQALDEESKKEGNKLAIKFIKGKSNKSKTELEKPGDDAKEGDKLLGVGESGVDKAESSSKDPFVLSDITFDLPKGSFLAIIGSVGSGKSSVLNSILGEMRKCSGSVNVDGSMAYVGQQVWIRNTTVKENILFGSELDQDRYDRTIEACALLDDLKILDNGDETEIGEKGINLSGGQKARISLARAVYSNRDIYLLDDPLAAVDAHVAAHIYDKVIGPSGVLCNKSRILVTNKLHILTEADVIINLQDGKMKEIGSYCELMNKVTDDELSFVQLCKAHLTQQQLDDNACVEESSGSAVEKDIRARVFTEGADRMSMEKGEEVPTGIHKTRKLIRRNTTESGQESFEDKEETEENLLERASRIIGASRKSLEVISCEMLGQVNAENEVIEPNEFDEIEEKEQTLKESADKETMAAANVKEVKKLMTVETVETGKVNFKVYLQYGQSVGLVLSVLAVLGLVLTQILQYVGVLWIAKWSDDVLGIMARKSDNYTMNQIGEDLNDTNFNCLVIYGFIGFGFGVTVVVNSIIFLIGSMRASETLHTDMLVGVMRSALSFFETTPLGRITNRFSKDIDVVDNVLCIVVKSFIQCTLTVVCVFFAIAKALPVFLLLLVPLSVIYYLALKFYVATSRQIKRIESMWKSPLYSNFGETLQGLTDIRAYQMSTYFIKKNQELVDILVKTTYANLVLNRWLALRLETIGSLIVFATAFILVFFRDGVSPGNAGVALVYAISVSQVLTWLCRMSSEIETNIVAVERIREYCRLTPEADWESDEKVITLPKEWPTEGKIEVKNLVMKYREDLKPALNDVSCTFNPSEKIGIAGRTGSGKSTMTISLFRIVESHSGSIKIDSIDISKLGLHDLRSRITIIPQDPVIFVGTIRENLDPFNQYTDEQLWDALEMSHLKNFVMGLSEKLDFHLGEGGTNLSVGQRQLICLARAILRKTKILVLDEATASVDLTTDELIQNTIRTQFTSSTVVTIAHRINTIMDSDRILILEQGSVKEFGTPSELIESKGYFYSILDRENLLPITV